MGILIPFDPARKPHPRRPDAACGPAHILLFTGVRYERPSVPVDAEVRRAAPDPGPRGKGPNRRRKRA
ncbi:hypothetical protein [Prosthecodimorpha staleyi]|uniref:Uncharacterized protein n=1 Tax=Prosthecodimorpha staleyi TaxID=2840188 RepID=A0A947GIA0_9HYPH|nr:hypothetical protein [Prosthecodimorpha staleyi]MBT9289144.1 hypothetical protein [Prosthecodimorpha staleyi]